MCGFHFRAESNGGRLLDAQMANRDYKNLKLRDGGPDSGRTAVAVVGTGGYKNERQQKTGDHWAKIYATQCKQDACLEASDDTKFGALICDFNEDKNWANCHFKVRRTARVKAVSLFSRTVAQVAGAKRNHEPDLGSRCRSTCAWTELRNDNKAASNAATTLQEKRPRATGPSAPSG
eukprot:265336-Prorocentrum_minimum.AAC.9